MEQKSHVGYPYAPVPKRTINTTEDFPPVEQQQTVIAQPQRLIRPLNTDVPEQEEDWPGRLPTSSRRYPVQDGRTYQEETPPKRVPRKTTTVIPPVAPTRRLRRVRFHRLVFLFVVFFVMLVGFLLFNALGSWWQTQRDDWTYGRPRTYQTDAVVGHGDSATNPSHFIALNLNGQVLVIEIPGGNAAKAQVYIGPRLFGAGEDLVPVTLSFEDCNGDGKPDLNIHIAGSDKIICFVNNGKTFTTTQQQP